MSGLSSGPVKINRMGCLGKLPERCSWLDDDGFYTNAEQRISVAVTEIDEFGPQRPVTPRRQFSRYQSFGWLLCAC